MKKEDIEKLVSILATVALVMILTFQMWHTVGLYLTYTKITHDIQKEFAAYFLAFTIELMVFIFVWNGNEQAGAWFSICLFFVGILFNEEYTDVDINITFDPFQVNRFYLPAKFISSTLLQFMSSLSIWYLTELHTKSRQKQLLTTVIAELTKSKAELTIQEEKVNQRLLELKKQEASVEKSIRDKTTELKGLLSKQTRMEETIEEYNQTITTMQTDVQKLKKQKAGFTGGRPKLEA